MQSEDVEVKNDIRLHTDKNKFKSFELHNFKKKQDHITIKDFLFNKMEDIQSKSR